MRDEHEQGKGEGREEDYFKQSKVTWILGEQYGDQIAEAWIVTKK